MKKLKSYLCSLLALAILPQTLNASEFSNKTSKAPCALFLVESNPPAEAQSYLDFSSIALWLQMASLDSVKIADLLFAKNNHFRQMALQTQKNWQKFSQEDKDLLVGDYLAKQLYLWQKTTQQQRSILKNRELHYLGFAKADATYFLENFEFIEQSQINRKFFESSARKRFAPVGKVKKSILFQIDRALRSIQFRFIHPTSTHPKNLKAIPLITDFHLRQVGLPRPQNFFSDLLENSASIEFYILASVNQERESKSTYPYNTKSNFELIDTEMTIQAIGSPVVTNEIDIQNFRQLQSPNAEVIQTYGSRTLGPLMRELVLTKKDTLELIASLVRTYLVYEASWDESAVLSRLESWKQNPHLSQAFIHSTIFNEMGFVNGFWLRVPGNLSQNSLRPLPRVDL